MIRSLLAASVLLLALAASASAQKLAIWKCPMPAGTYEVALRAITAVSIHQYTIEGGLRISELTIDTTGNTEARFYYMETASAGGGIASGPVDAAQTRLQAATDRAGTVVGGSTVSDLQNSTVVKNYPSTTHAHTVEYRVGSRAELDDLFKSIEAAWTTNTSTSYDSSASNGKTTTAPGN